MIFIALGKIAKKLMYDLRIRYLNYFLQCRHFMTTLQEIVLEHK